LPQSTTVINSTYPAENGCEQRYDHRQSRALTIEARWFRRRKEISTAHMQGGINVLRLGPRNRRIAETRQRFEPR
jgi:hypothetical protein